MLKILHVAPAYYPAVYWGGPTFSVYALNNALVRLSNISLKILTTDSAGPELSHRIDTANLNDLYKNQDIFITRRIAGLSISIELLMKLPKLVRWADVVHLTATYSFPTIPTLLLCYIYNKPLVWSPRGAIQEAYEWAGAPNKRLKLFWEKICNIILSPDRVITHTTSERERIATQERLPNSTAVIIPNGVDVPESCVQREWLPDNRLRLMYLGRLSQKKGIENLLHTIAKINDPSVSLTIYGTGDVGYTVDLKKLAKDLNLLDSSVVFAGNVNGKSKINAFYTADVCIIPSFTENFCIVVAEALAYGVPVIASKGTPWARVEEKQCGLWVDGDPDSLAQAITNIRKMDLMEMGRNGRSWMTQEFSWDTVAIEMTKIYLSLLRQKNHN